MVLVPIVSGLFVGFFEFRLDRIGGGEGPKGQCRKQLDLERACWPRAGYRMVCSLHLYVTYPFLWSHCHITTSIRKRTLLLPCLWPLRLMSLYSFLKGALIVTSPKRDQTAELARCNLNSALQYNQTSRITPMHKLGIVVL